MATDALVRGSTIGDGSGTSDDTGSGGKENDDGGGDGKVRSLSTSSLEGSDIGVLAL
ncbi:hypothetical protein Tco_0495093, partial [Tanacetum coccineum]